MCPFLVKSMTTMRNGFTFWGCLRLVLIAFIPLIYVGFFYANQQSFNIPVILPKIPPAEQPLDLPPRIFIQDKDNVDNDNVTIETKDCIDSKSWNSLRRKALRGHYWVLYNHVKATETFECLDSITYTTHGEFKYLQNNLANVIKRWKGPLSMAIYSPGSDYEKAMKTIYYYRECTEDSPMIKALATFHLFFHVDHMPKTLNVNKNLTCNDFEDPQEWTSYRVKSNLDYPVNVARSIARESVNTHFVFASDVELYPSPGLIPKFIEMIKTNGVTPKTVYVTPIFEIEAGRALPDSKNELVHLIAMKKVIPFHQHFCAECHTVPKYKDWLSAEVTDNMSIFHSAKRRGHWEPIYIGTNEDPPYDERLSWDGRADKMTQGYILCVEDYNFAILNNAFLIHKPGIKTQKDNRRATNGKKVGAQNSLIRSKILPELKVLFGQRKGCTV